MKRADWIVIAVVAVYAVGGFLTFGHKYNTFFCRDDVPVAYSAKNPVVMCMRSRELHAVTAGAGWPVYWAGRLSIEVMR